MTLGDGIRRNIATVCKEERELFIDAVKQLNQIYFSPGGSRTDFPAGHVSYWFKMDEIHQSSHVHGCPAFLPWHRQMIKMFEDLLRKVHPELSLHYWDWNLDPTNMRDNEGKTVNLFDSDFMGNANGLVEEPLKSAGFYVENPHDGEFRDNRSPVHLNRTDPNNPFTWRYPTTMGGQPVHCNPADPPKTLKRDKWPGAPPVGKRTGGIYWATDAELVNAPTWEIFNDLIQGVELDGSGSTNGAHALAHSYIGGNDGNLSDPHISFRDPFVFLVHSNVDRLWAMWQLKDPSIRLDPTKIYGTQGNSKGSGDIEIGEPNWGILSPLEPWAGWGAQTMDTGIVTNVWPIRPWFAPENDRENKNSKDISIVTPQHYDTLG
ncbi:MAG TPA: tyrosinase family protein [Nitrososphaera sp.]|jgi:hypothetical protein